MIWAVISHSQKTVCHRLKSRVSIEWQMLSINPHPPTRGREKEKEEKRQTYKMNIKSFTNNTNITNNINNKRNKTKYTNLTLSSLVLGAGALASSQQLPGCTRKSRTGLSSRQEPDPGMRGSESGSVSQVEQWAGSSSEGGHGRRQRDPRDPPALTEYAWHGTPRWSISGHLSCLPLPASATLFNSSLAGPKRSVGDPGCYSDNYTQGPFCLFLSYH